VEKRTLAQNQLSVLRQSRQLFVIVVCRDCGLLVQGEWADSLSALPMLSPLVRSKANKEISCAMICEA